MTPVVGKSFCNGFGHSTPKIDGVKWHPLDLGGVGSRGMAARIVTQGAKLHTTKILFSWERPQGMLVSSLLPEGPFRT